MNADARSLATTASLHAASWSSSRCGMFGFGYALVPIYDQICEALGINATSATRPRVGEHAGRHARARSRSSSTPTRAGCRGASRPLDRSVDVHPGELRR